MRLCECCDIYVNQLFGNRHQLPEGFDSEGNSVLPEPGDNERKRFAI